eukprot:Hpha_TRINITY_DN14342_c0_g2::TRINITY_DN14342_c0_g2_i2::g.86455::m.86455
MVMRPTVHFVKYDMYKDLAPMEFHRALLIQLPKMFLTWVDKAGFSLDEEHDSDEGFADGASSPLGAQSVVSGVSFKAKAGANIGGGPALKSEGASEAGSDASMASAYSRTSLHPDDLLDPALYEGGDCGDDFGDDFQAPTPRELDVDVDDGPVSNPISPLALAPSSAPTQPLGLTGTLSSPTPPRAGRSTPRRSVGPGSRLPTPVGETPHATTQQRAPFSVDTTAPGGSAGRGLHGHGGSLSALWLNPVKPGQNGSVRRTPLMPRNNTAPEDTGIILHPQPPRPPPVFRRAGSASARVNPYGPAVSGRAHPGPTPPRRRSSTVGGSSAGRGMSMKTPSLEEEEDSESREKTVAKSLEESDREVDGIELGATMGKELKDLALEALKARKEQAVQDEDYDEALRLKQKIDILLDGGDL